MANDSDGYPKEGKMHLRRANFVGKGGEIQKQRPQSSPSEEEEE